jgi:hypothetical protein
LAKPNYSFAKRQREIAKKQKKEEKRLRKAGPEEPAPVESQHEVAAPPVPEEKPIP